MLGESERLHFVVELFPILSFLLLLVYHFGVALLYEVFSGVDFFFGGFGEGKFFGLISHL